LNKCPLKEECQGTKDYMLDIKHVLSAPAILIYNNIDINTQ